VCGLGRLQQQYHGRGGDRQRCQDDAGEDLVVARPSVLVGGLFGRQRGHVVAVTGRLIDVQRLEKVIEAAGEVLPEHVAIVQASFAVRLRCGRTRHGFRSCWVPPNPPVPPPGKPPNQLAKQGFATRFGGRSQSIAFTQDEVANTKGVKIMVHCRYCNRFRLTRLAGRGAWLLECGHTYLPLPSEAQTWAAYTRDPRPAA
jgi:hypothetical protein